MKWVELVAAIFHGTVLFVAVGIPAVALDLLLQWLPTIGVSPPIIFVLACLEWVIFFGDAALLLIFILTVVWRTLWKL